MCLAIGYEVSGIWFIVSFISFVTGYTKKHTHSTAEALGSRRIMGRGMRLRLDCLSSGFVSCMCFFRLR